MEKTQIYRVSEAWEASYGDPIRVARDAPLELSGREDIWDGHRWLWATSGGREGWVPDSLVRHQAAGPVAAFDYSAMELSCPKGARLTAGRETHGWVWCRAEDGREGWVPRRNLTAT